MKNLLIPLIIATSIFLVGCGDPKNKVIPTDQSKWDAELKPEIEKLTEEEKKLFGGYVMRAKLGEVFGGSGLQEGTTIGQGIEMQKKWLQEQEAKEAEQKALKQKVENERAAIAKQINDAVTIAVVDLFLQKGSFESGDLEDKQVIKLAIKNKTAKDITGVKGSIRFIDIFDKEVGNISFGYDEGISAGETATWTGSRRYNQFIEEHKAIANLQEGKYKIAFDPEAIVYADGTKILMPQ